VILPVLVWLGFEPKKASAPTSLVVVFASLAGFLGHVSAWSRRALAGLDGAGGRSLARG
jgi:hypothetical protein